MANFTKRGPDLSRNMDVSRFIQNGLSVKSMTSLQLAQAAVDLFECTKIEGDVKSESRDNPILHPLETKFNLELRNSRKGEFMRIPKSYLNFLASSID